MNIFKLTALVGISLILENGSVEAAKMPCEKENLIKKTGYSQTEIEAINTFGTSNISEIFDGNLANGRGAQSAHNENVEAVKMPCANKSPTGKVGYSQKSMDAISTFGTSNISEIFDGNLAEERTAQSISVHNEEMSYTDYITLLRNNLSSVSGLILANRPQGMGEQSSRIVCNNVVYTKEDFEKSDFYQNKNGEKRKGVLYIPNGVTTIKAGVIAGDEITAIMLPGSIKNIDDDSFVECPKLGLVCFENENINISKSIFKNNSNVGVRYSNYAH